MQVEEKNRQLNEDAETIEEKNELQTGKKKHRKNNFAAGMAVGAAAAIMGCSLAGIYFSRHYRYSSLATAYSSRGTKTATSSTVESQNQEAITDELMTKLKLLEQCADDYFLFDTADAKDYQDNIYKGFMNALDDPYSCYYTADEYQTMMESTSGTFSGVGATLTKDADTGYATIVNVYEDSPAEKAGLKAGDILEKIDDHEVGDEQLDTVVSWIKGEKGTDVKITVLRDGEELELTATRDTIEVKTVSYEMKENQIGYIRVSEFDTVTYDQFKEALDDLEKQGMQGLIVDLRNNPGGSLDTVTNMLRLLLPEGTIVSTKDKNGKTDEITCDGTHEFKKPMAVLVNQYSASASEIFSGAVQDYGTAKIVGVTTYGKGVVQQLMDLGDGTCLKVTIAEYYTPNGRSINGKGVEPDVKVEYQYDEENPKADNQLDQALSTVQGEISESTQNR